MKKIQTGERKHQVISNTLGNGEKPTPGPSTGVTMADLALQTQLCDITFI